GALAHHGARAVAVERPGWRGMAETARFAGLSPVEVEVDEDGLRAERLWGLRADAVAVAPAHQYPTGAVLGAERRSALVAWARERGGVIVEDDYDAEYRYDRRPIGALQGLAPEHVVYGGSVSKTIAPALRIGWLALPEHLVDAVLARRQVRGGTGSSVMQLALADLMGRGDLDRHLRRQRHAYRRRRDLLLRALAEQLPALRVTGAAAGLYVAVELDEGDVEAALALAAREGIALEGFSGRRSGLVLGYGNLAPAAIPAAVGALARCLGGAARA
ncbi:MAG: PLP-dependent aminotransferase family protein, partial [Acidobacteriota bacterium]|nr:PLP-dependent aminotransferase family protein [Acidobacteriota bacterium]